MKIVTVLSGAIFLSIFTTLTPLASGGDWSSCAYELDRLRRAARDAADKANEVNMKAQDLENCRRYPKDYGYGDDKCRSKLSDYEIVVSSLDSKLITVESRFKSAHVSCSSTTAGPARRPSGNYLCDLFRRYIGQLSFEKLLEVCVQSMSEADCKKCLTAE